MSLKLFSCSSVFDSNIITCQRWFHNLFMLTYKMFCYLFIVSVEFFLPLYFHSYIQYITFNFFFIMYLLCFLFVIFFMILVSDIKTFKRTFQSTWIYLQYIIFWIIVSLTGSVYSILVINIICYGILPRYLHKSLYYVGFSFL